MNGIVVGLLATFCGWSPSSFCCVHHHYNGQPRSFVHAEIVDDRWFPSGQFVDGENDFTLPAAALILLFVLGCLQRSGWMLACSRFYDHAQLLGAIIIFALVPLELIAMYPGTQRFGNRNDSVWALLLTE